MINEAYKAMLGGKSVIRELSEYATARGAEIGYENVFDYSLGNPSVPCPQDYTDAVIDMYKTAEPVALQLFHHKLHDVLEKSRYFRSMLHRPVCRNRKRKDQQKYDQETDMGCGNPHRLSEKLIGKDAVNHKINVSRTI